jgi:hypothetical protein
MLSNMNRWLLEAQKSRTLDMMIPAENPILEIRKDNTKAYMLLSLSCHQQTQLH